MPSGNAEGRGLSIFLVAMMILPLFLSISQTQISSQELDSGVSSKSSKDFGATDFSTFALPEIEDETHGWVTDKENFGKAFLFNRDATYLPILDWSKRTGESTIVGWHVLAHDYPIPSDWKGKLESLGMECQTFVAPHGFHCDVPKLTPYQLHDVGVVGAFRLDPSDKIAPDVIGALNGTPNGAIMQDNKFVMTLVLSGNNLFRELIETGVEVLDYRSDRIADVLVNDKEVELLISESFVEWIEPSYPSQLDNQAAADIIDADWVGDVSNMVSNGGSLTGEGIIVGVMDSGLDTGVECNSLAHCSSVNSGVHSDFAGRIIGMSSYTCTTCTDGPNDPNGHGTHVAGSVLGNGANSDTDGVDGSDHSGVAPDAHLFMQGVYAEGGTCGGSRLCPPSYETFLTEAYNAGARIHTNSWGTGPDSTSGCSGSQCWNYYSSASLELDTEANDFEDLTILFAMGNDAMDCSYNSFDQLTCSSGKDGEINLGAHNRQATAKNILSIGASENFRYTLDLYSIPYRNFCTFGGYPAASGECPHPHTDEKWSQSPIFTDTGADDPEGMAAFSNRGPTADGRIKPDLVAPGTWIISTRSSEADERVGYDLSGGMYTHKYGTSMATPITAGSIALVLEYLNNIGAYDCHLLQNPPSSDCPDSALIKAIMAAGAHDLMGQYNSGGDGENGAVEKAPNNHEGWGRVDLQSVIGSGFTEGIDIATDESHSFKLTIPDSGIEQFRIVLAWNDPPNSPLTTSQLRNDLDIMLKSPSGVIETYSNDAVNNLVGITVDGTPEAGDWEVIVTGVQVIDSAQKYYLASNEGVITDMRHPVSDGLVSPGFQAGSIFTETTMSVGGNHICAILDDSSLQCWGENSNGQLGDGTTIDRLTMTEVSLPTGRTAVSVSAGHDHTCAVLDNGELVCWGSNEFGQLGDGSEEDSNVPVYVDGLSGVPVQISSGGAHSCAILNDASMECWGANDGGQLGDNSFDDSANPVSIALPETVLGMSAGAGHTCAVLSDSSLHCWGNNENGQLGDGSAPSDKSSPVSITVGGDAVAVSAGGAHTCVIFSSTSKSLKCWGDNSFGQLGDGGTNQQNDANSVSAILTGITTLEIGAKQTCAVDTTRMLHCWGGSSEGQVGDGSTSNQVTSITAIDLGLNLGALSIASGGSYTCAVATNDLARCWGGSGSDGGLSIGSSPEEFEIPRWSYVGSSERDWNDNGDLNIFEVNVASDMDGDGFPVGLDSDDTNPTVAASCGTGEYGRFTCRQATPGYYVSTPGSTVMTPTTPGHYTDTYGATDQSLCSPGEFQELPAQTSCEDARPGYFVSDPGASEGTPCPAGKYNDEYGQISADACKWAEAGHSVPVLTQVSSGALHSCAILDDGSVSCWGENSNGQLGDGTRTDHHQPEKAIMPLGRTVSEISSGSYHSCALMDDGSVRCWGSNEFGQLGDGTTLERLTAVSADLSGGVALSISAGESHTCAVMEDTSLMCWGDNSNGQLGDGSRSERHTPISVPLGDAGVHEVSSGSYHTCAIMADRSLRCWGDNWHGQLGDGSFSDKLSPVDIEIPSNSSAVTVDSGAFHSCVGMNDGSMYCWGYNSYGQLGNGGTTRAGIPMPVPLDSTQSPTDIQVGLFHSCALFDSGEMSCWGDNAYGQIGDGTPISGGWHLPKTLVLDHEVLSISVGHRHSCAILTDASLQCWGINSKGQVGDGSTTNRYSPTVIDLGHGSKEQLPCSPGTYQPNSSQTSCILADRGFSVPYSGELEQIGCTRGTYSSLKGQATCTLASLGFYVSEFEAVTQTACPDGQSTLNLGSTNFDNCMNDFDGDKIPDQFDSDADNDGVPNTQDFDWLDPNISADSDGDNIPDSIDLDDDNDGFNDTEDAFPNNQAEWKDGDGDGIGDNTDNDDDGDGRSDWFDVFPDNPEEWSDFDGDTFGDNADPDDDNDGLCDDPKDSYEGSPPDLDDDGLSDCIALPNGDAFPLDEYNWYDTDGDSIGDQNDTDDDNDGYNDTVDAFSLDPSEWNDTDGDNIGDNRDLFPNDSTEWQDSDSDGIGDNTDECPYEAGINPSMDNMIELIALPGNELGCPVKVLPGDDIGIIETDSGDGPEIPSSETAVDTDGDGISDYYDVDDDNDGILDIVDGDLGADGFGVWSKDPGRPLSSEAWIAIVSSIAFIGFMGYRAINWKDRGVTKLRSKRIRIQ